MFIHKCTFSFFLYIKYFLLQNCKNKKSTTPYTENLLKTTFLYYHRLFKISFSNHNRHHELLSAIT